jgi:hypothetical protein
VEVSAFSETKEKSTHRVRDGDVGAPTALGSFAHTNQEKDMHCLHPAILLCVMMWKGRLMLVSLDRLTPYVGTARHERP